jgi:hypothetical protein
MEAPFPFSALEGKKDLSAPVEITIPFGIFLILEVFPGIFVNDLKPLKAVL